MERLILKNIDVPNARDLNVYVERGGYQALKKALEGKPEEVIEAVKASGLRGRGGAGFPTGLKWGFCAGDPKTPRYLICNADESEPGTFKDRVLMERDPHLIIEGCAIAAYAISAERGYVYIRGEYPLAIATMEKAIRQATEAGYLGSDILGSGMGFNLHVHAGAGAYICGEETALLESIEGKRGQPRAKPPFPASVGLFNMPTVINNVETLANVPLIIERGPGWYSQIGTEKSKGPKLFCVSGHVNRPGVYELPLGTTLRELIEEHAGGVWQGRQLKALIPGGASAAYLTAEHLDIGLDFESVAAAGSMLGSGAVIVMDETTCMVKATLNLIHFFKHESCGKCTPCREGTTWLYQILRRIEAGRGRSEDLDLILDICKNIGGTTLCPLADGAIQPVKSSIQYFRDEYEAHIQGQGCPMPVLSPPRRTEGSGGAA